MLQENFAYSLSFPEFASLVEARGSTASTRDLAYRKTLTLAGRQFYGVAMSCVQIIISWITFDILL